MFAVESGSRAWGFPSPDSDYDCRFVYARSVGDHLVLSQPRDVIEFALEGDIDVGGWDLRKALLLALGGNAVTVEWTRSPIVYDETIGFRKRFISLLDRVVDPRRVAHHYLGLARAQIAHIGGFAGDVKLKKLLYLIRPIVALDWMEQRDFSALPPMNMLEGLAGIELAAAPAEAIGALIELKSRTRELGVGPIPAAIAVYLEAQYRHHVTNLPDAPRDPAERDARRVLADAFYRREIEAIAQGCAP